VNSNSIILKGDSYVKQYGNKYIQKINYLQKLITEQETGESFFKVVNFEAGLGKSLYTDLIIKEYLNQTWENRRKFLIVKRFNEESYRSSKRIEQGFLTNISAVVTADTWDNKWKHNLEELISKPVIIISHKRYIDLCLNDDEREIFTTNRHTLIIDEKVNLPIYTYSDEFYGDVRKLINRINRDLFDKTCENLNQILGDYEGTTACFRVYPQVDNKTLDNFNSMMLAEIRNNKNLKEKRFLNKFLDTVNLCYDKNILAVINSGKICTFNRKHSHWGLKNNIILDASAAIDGIYLINPDKYILQRQTRIIDHKKSEFIHIKCNSSKSFIKQNQEMFFKKIIGLIKERHNENEKTLLVIHKDFSKQLFKQMKDNFGEDKVWKDKDDEVYDSDYNNQPYAISWFGNLIGKNTFQDFNNVWILGTPNIPLNNYLIHYMQYSGKSLGKKGLKVFEGKFKNTEFRLVQEGYIAAEIYQSLKRIQRKPLPEGKFYVVTKDEEIVETVISQMKNAKITEQIELEFKDETTTNKITKEDLVYDYFKSHIGSKTKINKADIKRLYKITRFDRLKEHPKIKQMIQEGRLKEQHRYFIVS
jgi:hypothetical protein